MSTVQKMFIVNSRTPANAARHALHTFTVKNHAGLFLYRWQCACGYTYGGALTPGPSWANGPMADAAYTDHSGVTLPAWPPMDAAVDASQAPLLTAPTNRK